jgi:hypothetical protein
MIFVGCTLRRNNSGNAIHATFQGGFDFVQKEITS